MIGWMACSKAGHDKDKIYIIIEETDKYVWLADGDIRKADNPKRKSRKHIQVIKKTADEQLFANPACINCRKDRWFLPYRRNWETCRRIQEK